MKSILSIILLTTISAVAQTPEVHEEMTVNLVELDVKVQTIGGKYISGLPQFEFQVLENGDPQEITHFEEVDLMQLPEEEVEDYTSKVMILLDFQNSAHQDMRKVFKDLRDYFDTTYDGKSMIGLAVNSGGIAEILPFTRDVKSILNSIDTAENLFSKALYKDSFFQNMIVTGLGGDPAVGLPRGHIERHQLEVYFRNQIMILGQFLNYIGVHSGKKSVILVSGPWGRGEPTDGEGNVNDDAVLSVRDIQTSCLFNKISINVISLNHPDANISRARMQRRNVSVFDRTVELASMSSGSYKKPANSLIYRSFADTVDRVGRFYRIRYYSNIQKNKYRRIKVKVKGLNRIVNTLSGYYPGAKQVSNVKVDSEVNMTDNKNLQLQLKTDWMEWGRKNRKEISSNYAIGYRVYGDQGTLVAEHVAAGEVSSPKGVFPILKQNIQLDLQPEITPVRIETIITDLMTGKRVEINTLNSEI